MRKLICILLTILLVAAPVMAAEVEQYTAVNGMSKSWYQGYEPTIKNNTMTICLPIKTDLIGPVTVSIALTDPNVYLLASQPKAVTVSEKDGIYPVRLTLSLQKDRRNGDYPAIITLKSGEKTENLPYTIRIRDGRESHEDLSPVISEVTANLDVGTNGSLRLTIANPTSTHSLTDGVLTITDPTGEVLMTGSDRFPVPEILPGEAVTVSVPMTVLANAAIRVHPLNLKLRYEVLGSEMTWEEAFTVPVTQAIRPGHAGHPAGTRRCPASSCHCRGAGKSDLATDESGQGRAEQYPGEIGNPRRQCPERPDRLPGTRRDETGPAHLYRLCGQHRHPQRHRHHFLRGCLRQHLRGNTGSFPDCG